MLPYVLFLSLVLVLSEYILLIIDGCKIFERSFSGITLDIACAVIKRSIETTWLLLNAVMAAMYYIVPHTFLFVKHTLRFVKHTLRFVKSKTSARVIEEIPRTALDELAEKTIITHQERRILIAAYLEKGIILPNIMRYVRTSWEIMGKDHVALTPLNNDLRSLLDSNGKMMYFDMNEANVKHVRMLSQERQIRYDLAAPRSPRPTTCALSCV